MMRHFHELRRHEEGQALVLAAISMLILTLCVIATVNLTFAVNEKIKLQNAADAAAYTSAAYQARALNFFAYTNRSMVVRYCAQMNIMATMTYIIFLATVITGILMLLSLIPGIGGALMQAQQIMMRVVQVLDIIEAIVVPLIDVMNLGTSLVQNAVSIAMLAKAGAGVQGEVQGTNPAYRLSFLSQLLGIDGAKLWWKTVSTGLLPPLFPSSGNAEEKFNRLLMVEIANSGRHPWTAYGGNNGSLFPGLLRRAEFKIPFLGVRFGKVAKTEWGAYYNAQPTNAILQIFNAVTVPPEQLFSADRFYIWIGDNGKWFKYSLDVWLRHDRAIAKNPWHDVVTDGPKTCGFCDGLGFLAKIGCKIACNAILAVSGIGALLTAAAAAMNAVVTQVKMYLNSSRHPHLHFGLMPYARFRPGRSDWKSPKGAEHFNQPPVMALVTFPTSEIVKKGKPFMANFAARLGSLTGANSPLQNQAGGLGGRGNTQAPKRGWKSGTNFNPVGLDVGIGPLSILDDGFHAFSAAMAYYHRPGDWREPPNLFNPFWGAKLMPVNDHPMLATNPIFSNPVVSQFFSQVKH